MSLIDEFYMRRCIQLAILGAGNVAPNPMVGAVLVYNDRVIGEGYHELYGGAHAEVNCMNSVKEADRNYIQDSTIYVSLEPCSHFGRTPPCADLIIAHQIKKAVIGTKDIYEQVAGSGIRKLEAAGIEVVVGVLDSECRQLNKRFFTFHNNKRPYIILKWAQSANGKIGSSAGERILISNEYSNRLVHRWRSEEAGILVGTHTALKDNPHLNTRLWKGKDPVRIVIDKNLSLSETLHVYDQQSPTIVFNEIENKSKENIQMIQINSGHFLEKMLHELHLLSIQSILVEGGSKTLQSFIDAGLWDEARVITNEELLINEGVAAPDISNFNWVREESYFNDRIDYYFPKT